MLKKKIIELGLMGFLSMAIAGCATVQTVPVTYSGYVKGESRIEDEKIKTIQSISFTIDDIMQKDDELKIDVSEEKKENKIRIGTKVTPVYDATYNRTETYDKTGVKSINFLASVFGASAPFDKPNDGRLIERGKEKEISRKFVKEEREPFQEPLGEELAYSNKPANVMLRVSSKDIGFNEGGLEAVFVSASDGKAEVKMTRCPEGSEILESKLRNKINDEFRKGLTKLGNNSVEDTSILLPFVSYPVTIETNSQANAGLLDENIRFKDDKKVFSVRAKKADFRYVYAKLEKVIKADLEKEYSPQVLVVRVLDEDTHAPIDGAVVSFKRVKGLSLDELMKGADTIIKRYCIKDSIFYDYIVKNVNPSNLLADIDNKEIEISNYGRELAVNVPSEYEIETVHNDYYSLSTMEKFPRGMQGTLDLYLSKVGEKVRIDSGKSRGKSVRK